MRPCQGRDRGFESRRVRWRQLDEIIELFYLSQPGSGRINLGVRASGILSHTVQTRLVR
jgi:hypothetical protein